MDRSTGDRLVAVDLLRTLSIAIVLSAHLAFTRNLVNPQFAYRDSQTPSWHLFAQNGGYGVSIFFVISGFLITRILMLDKTPMLGHAVQRFYIRRVARILPLLLLVTLVGAGMYCAPAKSLQRLRLIYYFPLGSHFLWVSIATFWFNWYRILTEQHLNAFGLHWGILWSLSVEEQFYLLYPLFVKHLRSLRRLGMLLLAVIILGSCFRVWIWLIRPDNYLLSLTGSVGDFDQIAMGCLLYIVWNRYAKHLRQNKIFSATLAVAGLLLMATIFIKTSLYTSAHRTFGPTLIVLGAFLFLLGILAFDIPQNRLSRTLCLPGKVSYGMYVWHPTVLYFCWNYIGQNNPWLAFSSFFILTTIFSLASYTFFEKPTNRWVRNFFGRADSPSHALR